MVFIVTSKQLTIEDLMKNLIQRRMGASRELAEELCKASEIFKWIMKACCEMHILMKSRLFVECIPVLSQVLLKFWSLAIGIRHECALSVGRCDVCESKLVHLKHLLHSENFPLLSFPYVNQICAVVSLFCWMCLIYYEGHCQCMVSDAYSSMTFIAHILCCLKFSSDVDFYWHD